MVNVPARSRGTSTVNDPTSDSMVFEVVPLRALGRCRLALLVAQMASQLSLQTPLEGGLEQCGQQPIRTGDLDLAGVDLGEQLVQSSAGLELSYELIARLR